jgi:uracil-DNA glycosylase
MKIVFVGEAWGRSEEQFRYPLVGASGRELTLQIGQSGLGPYLTKTCRKCKQVSRFVDARCENCHEHLWPDEFDLIAYWKSLRESDEIHVTNVFNLKPPDVCVDCGSSNIRFISRIPICNTCSSRNVRTNEIGYLFGTEKETEMPAWKASKTAGGSHLLAEYFHHVQRLWDELRGLRPNIVVAMGNAACWAILGQTKITSLRGTVNWSDRLGLKVLPVFHPAAILRQWAMRPTSIADLRKAAIEREFPEIRRPERWITIPHPSPRGIDEISAWLSNPATRILANDIETVRGQISIIGFARDPSNSLVVPFRDCHSQGGQLVDIGRIGRFTGNDNAGINFWPTAELEQSAWKLCIDTIQSKRIELIFQNGIYDMSYYLRMGILPQRATHDTMLWHHSEYPELPKALGFLGSLYSNDIAWKQMSRSSDSLKRDE